MNKIICYLLFFSSALAEVNVGFGWKLSNLNDIGNKNHREFSAELLTARLRLKNRISNFNFSLSLNHNEPNPCPGKRPLSLGINSSLDLNYEFLRIGIAPYVDESYYRIIPKDYLLFIQGGHLDVNALLFVEPNFSFLQDGRKFNIALMTGFQKTDLNRLTMIPYKLSLSVESEIGLFHSTFQVFAGRSEIFETVRPLNLHDVLDFLDSFRIKARINTIDFYTVKMKQLINLVRGRNDLEFFIQESVFYRRDKEDIHQCVLVVSAGLNGASMVTSLLDFSFSLRVDFEHRMHAQENRVWFVWDSGLDFNIDIFK